MVRHITKTANAAWLDLYNDVVDDGVPCAPRGQPIHELPHQTIVVDMQFPVVTNKLRRLNYKFMATEALWILSGRDDLKMVNDVNPMMERFSNDGVTLDGAYGPRVMSQVGYVVNKLIEDPDTRQASLTIWKPNPFPSKDIPCTIAMDFKIRNSLLNCHVFMRSSDVWLGLPYDIFAFSLIAQYVACLYNNDPTRNRMKNGVVCVGKLYLTATSSHVYNRNLPRTLTEWERIDSSYFPCERSPDWELGKPADFLLALKQLSESSRGGIERWWERPAPGPITLDEDTIKVKNIGDDF